MQCDFFSLILSMPAMPKTQFTEPAKRRFAALPANDGMGGKTAKQIWLEDAGTYPVIGVIGFACVFCFSYYAHNIATNPDIRYVHQPHSRCIPSTTPPTTPHHLPL